MNLNSTRDYFHLKSWAEKLKDEGRSGVQLRVWVVKWTGQEVGEERLELLVAIGESPKEGIRKVMVKLDSLDLAFERWPEVQLGWAAWLRPVRSYLWEA